jgi:hypothetical protein
VEHKLLEFFDWVISHGFKSIVTLPLVGEVGINFDAPLLLYCKKTANKIFPTGPLQGCTPVKCVVCSPVGFG